VFTRAPFGYNSALQPFLLWRTLEDVLTNSCTLFTWKVYRGEKW